MVFSHHHLRLLSISEYMGMLATGATNESPTGQWVARHSLRKFG